MQAPKRWQYLVPLGLIALACIMIAYWSYLTPRYRWVPVSQPIELDAGKVKTTEFQVDLPADYIIELVADRTLPSFELECLLGIKGIGAPKCDDNASPVDLTWKVTSAGGDVAQGTTRQWNGAAFGKDIRRQIGGFRGDAGRTYSLEVVSLRDASVLSVTNLRIAVSVNYSEYKNHYAHSQLFALAVLVLAIVGGVWLIVVVAVYAISRWRPDT